MTVADLLSGRRRNATALPELPDQDSFPPLAERKTRLREIRDSRRADENRSAQIVLEANNQPVGAAARKARAAAYAAGADPRSANSEDLAKEYARLQERIADYQAAEDLLVTELAHQRRLFAKQCADAERAAYGECVASIVAAVAALDRATQHERAFVRRYEDAELSSNYLSPHPFSRLGALSDSQSLVSHYVRESCRLGYITTERYAEVVGRQFPL
jgi:hypothetical protein